MRLLVWYAVCSAVVLLGWLLWGDTLDRHFTLAGSIAWLRGAGGWAWLAGIGLLVADLFVPLPASAVIAAIGFLYGPWAGGMISSAGLMAAGLLGYGLGRLCGEAFARRWLGEQEFAKGQSLFRRGGAWIVASSRALPLLPEVISCSAGLLRMPFWRFLLALACGSFPTGFLFAAIGSWGREAPAWTMAFCILLPALLWAVARKIH